MSREGRLPWIVAAIVVAVIGLPFAIDMIRDLLRPRLAEVRIVTATDEDRVFRTGPRRIASGVGTAVALALRIERRGQDATWLAPVDRLEIDGQAVTHRRISSWIEDDRQLRVFWFTVENTTVGGTLTAASAPTRLRHRSFIAPEMGRSLEASALPDQHNDDALGLRADQSPVDAGTIRLYARVELVDEPDAVHPLAVITTQDPEGVADPSFPTLLRAAYFGAGIDDRVGELFRLPGFEIEASNGGAADDVVSAVLGVGLAEAVRRRLLTTSWTFAATAATGDPDPDIATFIRRGPIVPVGGELLLGGRPLVWDADVRAGDLLVADDHWFVLFQDDGDGRLGLTDGVLHCWRSPPASTRLGLALDPDVSELALMRHAE